MDITVSHVEHDGSVYWMRVNHRFEIRMENCEGHLRIVAMPVGSLGAEGAELILPNEDFPEVEELP